MYIDLKDRVDYGFSRLTDVSEDVHWPDRLWIQRRSFKSVKLYSIPQSVPSPSGEG